MQQGRGILAKGKPKTDIKGEECRTYQISRMGDSCSTGFFAKTGLSRSRSRSVVQRSLTKVGQSGSLSSDMRGGTEPCQPCASP